MPNTPDHPILVGFKKLSTYFLTPAMLVGIIWYSATKNEGDKHVQFSNPVIKVQTEEYIKTAPDTKEVYQKQLHLDSIYSFAVEQSEQNTENKKDAIRSRAERDTVMQKQAITIYQLKEAQIRQEELTREILRKLDNN